MANDNTPYTTVTPAQLQGLLARAVRARLPVLVTGAPGIGKSEIVAEAARNAGAELILSHPVVSDPTDVKGLPWIGAGDSSATFLPFGDLQKALTATTPTVWFLDDLGQASPAVQASFMQLLLAREVNGHRLPECVTFVAATNRRTDRAGVSGILEPVKSRFATIVELRPSLEDWTGWALQRDYIPAEMIAFLRFREDLLCDFQATADLTNSPVPRTWANAAKLFSLGLSDADIGPVLAGAVGPGPASEFIAFLALYRELPNIDEIIKDPDAAPIPDKPATRYAVTSGVAARATVENCAGVLRYAVRLVDAGHGEFGVLMVKDMCRRIPEVTETKEFVDLVNGEFGELIFASPGR